jgi:xylose isomerase
MGNPYEPKPEHKYTFGLWTVENIGSDQFRSVVRNKISPVEIVQLLAEVGAYGVNFHNNHLVPFDATPTERDQIVREFEQALAERVMCYERLDQLSVDLLLGIRDS